MKKMYILRATACAMALMMMTIMTANVCPAEASLMPRTDRILIEPAFKWVVSTAKKVIGYEIDEGEKRGNPTWPEQIERNPLLKAFLDALINAPRTHH